MFLYPMCRVGWSKCSKSSQVKSSVTINRRSQHTAARGRQPTLGGRSLLQVLVHAVGTGLASSVWAQAAPSLPNSPHPANLCRRALLPPRRGGRRRQRNGLHLRRLRRPCPNGPRDRPRQLSPLFWPIVTPSKPSLPCCGAWASSARSRAFAESSVMAAAASSARRRGKPQT